MLQNGNDDTRFINCDFIGNTATVFGGGIAIVSFNNDTLVDSYYFYDNAAFSGGI